MKKVIIVVAVSLAILGGGYYFIHDGVKSGRPCPPICGTIKK